MAIIAGSLLVGCGHHKPYTAEQQKRIDMRSLAFFGCDDMLNEDIVKKYNIKCDGDNIEDMSPSEIVSRTAKMENSNINIVR